MFNRKGQTILEYTVIVIIIAGALVAMRDYMKRGIQGRWKSAVDDLGDQYDPQYINSVVNQTMVSNSQTIVMVTNGSLPDGTLGQWTNRIDFDNSVETKIGNTVVGAN